MKRLLTANITLPTKEELKKISDSTYSYYSNSINEDFFKNAQFNHNIKSTKPFNFDGKPVLLRNG